MSCVSNLVENRMIIWYVVTGWAPEGGMVKKSKNRAIWSVKGLACCQIVIYRSNILFSVLIYVLRIESSWKPDDNMICSDGMGAGRRYLMVKKSKNRAIWSVYRIAPLYSVTVYDRMGSGTSLLVNRVENRTEIRYMWPTWQLQPFVRIKHIDAVPWFFAQASSDAYLDFISLYFVTVYDTMRSGTSLVVNRVENRTEIRYMCPRWELQLFAQKKFFDAVPWFLWCRCVKKTSSPIFAS
jgi:hypothetical protein